MTKEIELTQGYKVLVDDDKYEYLMQWKWHVWVNPKSSNIYARRRFDKSRYVSMHRVIFPVEKGLVIDHIDRNGLNNQLSNLRIATRTQNQMNSIRFNSTGYKGVGIRESGRFCAKICISGKRYWLGTFNTAEEAAREYDKKAIELFSEFALLNFPKEKTS